MGFLKGFALLISFVILTGCTYLAEETATHVEYGQSDIVTRERPRTIVVLSEGAMEVGIPYTELLEPRIILEKLDTTSDFPGIYLISRSFVEQMVNTFVSLGHIVEDKVVTDTFIYMYMEYENYTYIIWWTNNQLTLAGDFFILREMFLR